jgi:hypothetical protein
MVQVEYPFSVTVSPITTTQPLTYSWRASDHGPIIRTGGLTDTASYTWTTPGAQLITVTAFNNAGAVTDTFLFTTNVSPTNFNERSLYLPFILKP